MSEEELNALLDIVDAKIAERAARDSDDGGLVEGIRVRALIDSYLDEFAPKEAAE